jgi:hypothetical protein
MPAACCGPSVWLFVALFFLAASRRLVRFFFFFPLAAVLVTWFIGMITSAAGMHVPAASHGGGADISVPSPGVC